MDQRELSTRLHDLLGAACRVRLPGPGVPADAGLAGLDAVKAGLRGLIREVSDGAASSPASRIRATSEAFPEGQVAGTRATVEHRHGRTRTAIDPSPRTARPLPGPAGPRQSESSPPRRAAEAEFANLVRRPAAL